MAIAEYGYACTRITKARRLPNGMIRARCNGVSYLVFTQPGITLPVAMRCDRAREFQRSC